MPLGSLEPFPSCIVAQSRRFPSFAMAESEKIDATRFADRRESEMDRCEQKGNQPQIPQAWREVWGLFDAARMSSRGLGSGERLCRLRKRPSRFRETTRP